MSQDSYSRRKFLGATGTAAGLGLAGCLESDDEEDPEYDLELSSIDLTDLSPSEMPGYSDEQIRDEYRAELTVYENGEELDTSQFDIELGFAGETLNQDHIPENKIEDGEEVDITVELGNETVQETTTLEKETGHGYQLEGTLTKDGETIFQTRYKDNFLFNTEHVEYENYSQKRNNGQVDRAHPGEIDQTWEHTDQEQVEQVLNDNSLTEKEQKREVLREVGNAAILTIGRHSSEAQTQAAVTEQVIKQETEFEDVYGSGFSNAADRQEEIVGNHGSKVYHIDGDWYHRESTTNETLHADNFQDMTMVENQGLGTDDAFVSVLAEHQEGDMEELRFEQKMSRQNRMYLDQLTGHGTENTINRDHLAIHDEYGSKGLERGCHTIHLMPRACFGLDFHPVRSS